MARRVTTTESIADGITPIAAYACATQARPGPSFLLESAAGPAQTSRYSIVGLGALAHVRVMQAAEEKPIALIREMLAALAPDRGAAGWWGRFLGAYGAFAFEFAGCLERLPRLPRGDDPMPDVHLVVPETVVVFDHFTHRMAIVTLSGADGTVRDDADLRAALAQASIPALEGLERSEQSTVKVDRSQADRSNGSSAGFVRAVERAKEPIAAGDVFQVVLSQAWEIESPVAPFQAYRALRTINPSPYMYYLDFGWGQLFGSSPETLVRLDGRTARVRPLAGTKPRDPDPMRERRAMRALKRDVKERAEHVMLVDLGRNDLGRVCDAGSVHVDELMSIELYSHVMHMVSEVRGTVGAERDALDVLAAAFPAGTVSGAPKIRAMELIAELEGRRRGFYAGSVGYIGFDGSLDACITLRSAHAYGGRYHVRAGAGIVADSVPEAEDRECAAKAGAVLAALGAPTGHAEARR